MGWDRVRKWGCGGNRCWVAWKKRDLRVRGRYGYAVEGEGWEE
jgi:hypothetical protein